MIKRFYYIEQPTDNLTITLEILNLGFMPLLWVNKGLYGLINTEKIINAIYYLQDQYKITNGKKFWVFHWSECTVIPTRIGKILTGQEITEKNKYD